MPHYVLSCGVDPEWLKTAGERGFDIGRNDGAVIGGQIKQMLAEIKTFKETHFEGFFLHPEDETEWEKFVTKLRSQKWDVICCGGGARTIPQLSDYFTTFVNQCITDQPGAKLSFPLYPKDVIPGVRKLLPDAV